MDLNVGLIECLPLLPPLRSAFCEHISISFALTRLKYLMCWASKLPSSLSGCYYYPPSLKQMGCCCQEVRSSLVYLHIGYRLRCDNSNLTLFYNFLLFFQIYVYYTHFLTICQEEFWFFSWKVGWRFASSQRGCPRLVFLISKYKYIILTLQPFVNKNFALFVENSL